MNDLLSQPGYPQRHHDEVHCAYSYACRALLITGIPFIVLLAGAVLGVVPAAVAALSGSIFLLFGLLGSASSLYDVHFHAQVLPYFERDVGNIDTFLHGKALIRYLKALDRVALEAGAMPLSSFGFNDDLRGEQLCWHSAREGIVTVNALIEWLERPASSTEASAPVRTALLEDLTKWQHALEQADRQGIAFCLLLRHCNSTSGHEWDVRKGSAF